MLLANAPAGQNDLILARDSDYFALDLESGEETRIAKGSLDIVVNFAFHVDSLSPTRAGLSAVSPQ